MNGGPQYQNSAGVRSITQDAQQHIALTIVGYIFPILFFLTFFTDGKNSPFARFHANQQLVLFLSGICIYFFGLIIPVIGWFIILPLGFLCIFIFQILGVINTAKERMKKLPLIGRITIIKYDEPSYTANHSIVEQPAAQPGNCKYCTICGTKNSGDSQFCTNCGERF